MTTRLIFRVLNEAGELLGWTEHLARAKGDGKLWTTSRVTVPIDTTGVVTTVSTHWPDVNVETRPPVRFATVRVTSGDTLTIYEADEPAISVGPMPGALPPVVVRRSVVVDVPVGAFLGTGMR